MNSTVKAKKLSVLEKARWFFNSKYYPFILFLTALISHTFSVEIFGIVVVMTAVCTGLLICDDFKFLITPFVVSNLMFSEKSVATGKYYGKAYLIAIACGVFGVLILLIIHFVLYRKRINLREIPSSSLFLGLVFFAIAVFLNGCLSNDYHQGNLAYAAILAFSITGIYFLLTIGIKKDPNLINYILYVLFLMSVLVTLELYIAFTNQIRFEHGQIVKESIKIGWGMWNNIGGYLAFLLPIHFYFASTVKKFGWMFYITGLISFVAIVLTLSRSSLLSAGISIVLCMLISCFMGVNKKANRIFTLCIFILGVIGIIVLWNKISSILGDYLARGFDDNGRFEIYEHGIVNFITNPFFGGGFTSAYATEHIFNVFLPPRYHNTIIQMMATCGIVGLLAYLFHRYQTIKLLLSRKKLFSIFVALCIGTMLCGSLLDNHLFNIYPAFIYSILLLGVEKYTELKED
ncbi:MAG: O-antigen ligase family protein [Clostridia bacterium]|nr:O-antigen ligase family protein [Clostridia bacterium]